MSIPIRGKGIVVLPLVMTFSVVLVVGLMRSSTRILQTSPRLGTEGKRCARTAHGNGSISLKKTGRQSTSAMRDAATENASMPEKRLT